MGREPTEIEVEERFRLLLKAVQAEAAKVSPFAPLRDLAREELRKELSGRAELAEPHRSATFDALRARKRAEQPAEERALGEAGPRRGPGRPGWTRVEFEEHWREAQATTKRPHTFAALAAKFKALDGTIGGVSGDHLRRLRRKRFPG